MSEPVTLIAEVDQPSVSMEIDNTPPPMLIEVGIPGPAGPDPSIVIRDAALAISGHRMVTVDPDGDLIYADNTIVSHAGGILGMTLNAAADGDPVEVKTYGEISEPSWTWTTGNAIFLAANGVLTQVAPTSGFCVIVATALSPTTIFLDKKSPVILS